MPSRDSVYPRPWSPMSLRGIAEAIFAALMGDEINLKQSEGEHTTLKRKAKQWEKGRWAESLGLQLHFC